ncbi:MAG: nuclear transport factor 2 family protein [Rikenellaceae bacterium]
MKKIVMTALLSVAIIGSLFAQTKVSVCQTGHESLTQIDSREGVDNMLAELLELKESGRFGSYDQAEVEFQIEYLECIEKLLSECGSADLFAQRLIVAYPTLSGLENIKGAAKYLYPDEVVCQEKEAVRARVQDYFDMVSNLDSEIATGLWASQGDVSIITPRTQFFGAENIMNDFLIKTFSSMKSRKLHSLSEVINIYGESANVQLYWIFDTIDANGEAHQTRGRETLIFEKINDKWMLVHVHYSRMPQ